MQATYKEWHDEMKLDAAGKKNVASLKSPESFTSDALELQIKKYMGEFLERRREGMLRHLGIADKQNEAYCQAGGREIEVGK